MSIISENNKHIDTLIDDVYEIQAYQQIEIFPDKLLEVLYIVNEIINEPCMFSDEQIKHYDSIMREYINRYKFAQ